MSKSVIIISALVAATVFGSSLHVQPAAAQATATTATAQQSDAQKDAERKQKLQQWQQQVNDWNAKQKNGHAAEMPKAGAADQLAVFGGVTVAASAAYLLVTRRKLHRA